VSTPESRIIVTADVTKVSEGFARVEADATRLTGALGKISRDGFKGLETSAKQGLDGIQRQVAGLTSLVTRVTGALAVLGSATGVVNYLRNVANELDALNDAADATGASVENLSALEDIGRRTGASFDTVSSILLKFNKQLEAASDPASEAAQAFRSIGLNADELRKLDPAEALQKTAKALSGFADNADKARFIQAQFGKSVREAAPFLNDLAQAGALVATTTSDQTKEVERFNKNLFDLSANVNGAARSLVTELVPALNDAFKAYKDVVDLLGGPLTETAFRGAVRLKFFNGDDFDKARVSTAEKLAGLQKELAEGEERLANPSLTDKIWGVEKINRYNEALRDRVKEEQRLLQFFERRSGFNPDYSNEGRNAPPAPSIPSIRANPVIPTRPQRQPLETSPRRLSQEELGGMLAGNLTRQLETIDRELAEGERIQAQLEEQVQRFSEGLLDQTAQINVSLITNDRARGEAQIELDRRVMQERLTMLKLTGVDTDAAQQALNANIVARQRALTEAIKPEWQRLLEEWNNTTEAMAKSYDNLMTGVVVRTEDALADFLRTGKLNIDSLADYVSDAIARMMAQQAIAGIGNFISLMTTGFAKGGAFGASGQITAFADGGVVSRPTFFGYAGGRMGLMGEAGPEAVMPLTRGPDGKLGVQTHGGSQPLNVTINAQSGVTRAELAAMLPGIKEQLKAELVGSMRRPGFAG
jgi:lambda family phage tail tape measure protein